MNDIQITFCGWVGSEITLDRTASGAPVVTFRVGSTPRRLRNGQWEDGPTAWFTVKAWRSLAEHVAESVQQGQPVVVQGRLVADVWRREDGSTSVKYVVVATTVGHDLARGTAAFTKAPRRQAVVDPEDARVREVIHAYDDGGPLLDSFGDPVPTPDPAPQERTPAPSEGDLVDPAA